MIAALRRLADVMLLALRDALRSGDVWVPGSRRYADPTTILMPAKEWELARADYCALVGAAGPQAGATAAKIKACCVVSYSPDAVRLLLGESYHPGGLA